VCELNREVEDTDRRVVHRTIRLKKKRRCPKKVLALHHHRRGVDDGNQKMGTLSSRHKRTMGVIVCFDFPVKIR